MVFVPKSYEIVSQLLQCDKARISYQNGRSSRDVKCFLDNCSPPPQLHIHLKNATGTSVDHEEMVKPAGEKLKKLEFASQKSQHDTSSSDSGKSQKVQVASSEFGESALAIQNYTKTLEIKAQDACRQKLLEFQRNREKLEKEAKMHVQEFEKKVNSEIEMKTMHLEQKNESQAAEIIKEQQQLKETHVQRRQVHDARFRDAEQAKRKLLQEENKRKEQANKEQLAKVSKFVLELGQCNSKLQAMVQSSKYQQYISDVAKKHLADLKTLHTSMSTIYAKLQQNGLVTDKEFSTCTKIVGTANHLEELISAELENATREGVKAAEEADKLAQLQRIQQQAQQQQQQQASLGGSLGMPASMHVPAAISSQPAAASGESLRVDIEAFKQYCHLQDNLLNVEKASQVLSSTAELKKLKSDIHMAVNTTINTITDVSGSHLLEKLKHLLMLLSGQMVEIARKRISLAQNPVAVSFCKSLIAKMIVKKGEELVFSNYKSAFAIAMVAAGLWREHPDFGDLLLAHFHCQCPYIVPYYIPKQNGQSDQDFFKSRGYRYEGTVVETQEKFLNRMSGIMRLYFSIVISSPPRGSHPHGIQCAWTWIARVLNIEPEPDITSTMLYDFFQVTGNMLGQVYRKQFNKLLHVLVKEMLPKLINVTSAAGSGAMQRLQLLLQNSIKNAGNIPQPEGYLESNFWLS